MNVDTVIYRLLCKGCGRKGPAAYSRAECAAQAEAQGWRMVADDWWCRRCASVEVGRG